MPARRRWVLALSALLLVAATVGAPAASAAAAAPRFSVTTNVDRVPGYHNRVFLRVRFTSTMANRKSGYARFVIPVKRFAWFNENRAETWGPGLQQTDPLANGYFAIDKGSCERARLDGVRTTDAVEKKWIDVKFDCKPGKSFSILWYPTSIWWNMDGTNGSDEAWSFPVKTRFSRDDRWTDRRGPSVTVTASPIYIATPSTWVTGPKQVVDVEYVPDPPGEQQWYLELDTTFTVDVTPISQQLQLSNPVRADTFESVLVVNHDLLNIERTIEVSPCVPGEGYDCGKAPFGLVFIDHPIEGTFSTAAHEAIPPSVAVIFGIDLSVFSTNSYDETGSTCHYHGGEFDRGGSGNLWNCRFNLSADLDEEELAWRTAAYDHAVIVLRTKEHCPTIPGANKDAEGDIRLYCVR